MWWILAPFVANAAPIPVELPEGVDGIVWTEALQLSGLATGSNHSGVWVRLVDDGATWRIEAHAADGSIRTAQVPTPIDDHAREEVAALARSLLRGSPLLVLPPLVSAPEHVQRVAPRKQPSPLDPPQVIVDSKPVPAPAEPQPPVGHGVADRRPPDPVSTWWTGDDAVVVEAPMPVEFPIGAWVAFLAEGVARPGSPLGPSFSVSSGLNAKFVAVGLSATWSPTTSIPAVSDSASMAAVGSAFGVFFVPIDVLRLGAHVGVDRRTWFDAGDTVLVAAVPWVGGSLSLPVAVHNAVDVAPTLRWTTDLRQSQVVLDGFTLGALPTTALCAGLNVAVHSFH